MRLIVRWQRIAFLSAGVLAALTVTGAELGAAGILLALPGLTALMTALVGGLLWLWAAMLRFERSGDDEHPGDGDGGSTMPEWPRSPSGGDWDRFEAELRELARERELAPA